MLFPVSSLRLASRFASNKRLVLASTRFASSSASSSKLFTEKHEWVSILKDKHETQTIGRVGISNHAQEALGDVVYVQLPDIGSKFAQFDEVGAIESVKAASEILSPISGEIFKINSKLEEKPGLVNTDCYGEGWLFEIKLDKSEELDKLMNEDKYKEYLKRNDSS